MINLLAQSDSSDIPPSSNSVDPNNARSALSQARSLKNSLVAIVRKMKKDRLRERERSPRDRRKTWDPRTVRHIEECVRSIAMVEAKLDAAVLLEPSEWD